LGAFLKSWGKNQDITAADPTLPHVSTHLDNKSTQLYKIGTDKEGEITYF
jgi:hypothetical protein